MIQKRPGHSLRRWLYKVMNENCYHLSGPSGVKLATQRIRQIMQEKNPQFIIRADVKSFYRSIPHFKLVQDLKQYYDDPKVLKMLEDIITNPIETPQGYKNPVHGIALRGPLSQFFSGIYLKKLDDAFNFMKVDYMRYQDDILILCQSKRQFNRCRRRLMEVLQERRLTLSRKKTRMGPINTGFHFLGIHYLGTQTQDYIGVKHANDDSMQVVAANHIANNGGVAIIEHQVHVSKGIVPHPRTLRKAREQVKNMVKDGVAPRRIRSYLHHWLTWWVRTVDNWSHLELLRWFLSVCFEASPSAYAMGLLGLQKTKTNSDFWNPGFQENFATSKIAV